jgi:hypothetical protein
MEASEMPAEKKIPTSQQLKELRKAQKAEEAQERGEGITGRFISSVAEECVDAGWLEPTNSSYRLKPLGREALGEAEGDNYTEN